MWTLYLKATKYNRLPSSFFAGLVDELTVYQFDNAVTWFGVTIENLLQERIKVGAGENERSEAKYELEDLLDPDFRVPRPKSLRSPKAKKQGAQDAIAMMMALASQKGSGVMLWGQAEPKPS